MSTQGADLTYVAWMFWMKAKRSIIGYKAQASTGNLDDDSENLYGEYQRTNMLRKKLSMMLSRDTITKILLAATLFGLVTYVIILALKLYDVLPSGSRADSYVLIASGLLMIAMITNDPWLAQRHSRQNYVPASATTRIVRWLLPIAFFVACLLRVDGMVILGLGGGVELMGLIILVRRTLLFARVHNVSNKILWLVSLFYVVGAIIVFGVMLRVVRMFGLL